MTLDVVPIELKQREQWVTWKYVPDSKRPDKPKKLPFNPRNGKPADSTNAQTWASFAMAVEAVRKYRHEGVGFVFSDDDPFFGGDLDDCVRNGIVAPWADHIINDMETYTEISPSGAGLKFFGVGALPKNIKRFDDAIPESIKPHGEPGGIELYHTARFFTVTGNHLAGTPTTLRNVNGTLARLAAALAPEEEERERVSPALVSSEYLQIWAARIVERAEETLRLAPEGSLHDTRIAMARLCGGLIPLGLATADDLEHKLYAARVPSAHHTTERRAIRDGLAMGEQKALTPPPPPPQPLIDSEGYAVCPVHKARLPLAKNGNGYKCHERDTSTASGWCDFWWKGTGYIEPHGSVVVAGEIIQAPETPTAMSSSRYVVYKLSGLRALPAVSWLVDGEIPAGLTTIVCGPSGAGKSFLMVDYMFQIARRFPDRSVVYIAPEGGEGYHMRADAWLDHFGGDEPDNIVFILQAVPILDPHAVNEFIAVVRSFNPILVIVDTLARCLVGGDENSAKDVGVFFYHTDMIRQATGAAIAVVHHTGKAGAYRGSSVLYGSVESWIDVANDDGLITVSCGKSKDSKPFPPRYLRMVESQESVVLVPADQVSQRGGVLTEAQRKILETLALDIFNGPGARRSELSGATGINDLTMYKVLSRLKREGHISQSKKGDPYFITGSGLAAIKAYHRELKNKREQDRLASSGGVVDAELANSQSTSDQLVTSSTDQLATSNNLLSIRESKFATSSDASSGDDLFPEVDPLTPIPEHLRMTTRMMLSSDIPANIETAHQRCEMYGVDFDAARAAVREGHK